MHVEQLQSTSDQQKSHTPRRRSKKRRWQISLKTFFGIALLVGILLPTGYYYVRQVQRRHAELSTQFVSLVNVPPSDVDRIKRKLRPLTLTEAMWHRDGKAFGPVHKLKLVRPASGTQDYRVIEIDARQLKKPTYLRIRFTMGAGKSGGSFDLFPSTADLSGSPIEQNQVRVQSRIGSVYDLGSDESASMILPLKPGDQYTLGATGNWLGTAGDLNTVEISMRLEDF